MAVAAPIAADASTPTWVGLVIAVLGSSAIGAIFGGYLTTRMRGHIEREEAWRGRLIEASDALYPTLAAYLTEFGALLPRAASGDTPLRNKDGSLTDEVAAAVKAGDEYAMEIEQRLGHLELLFSAESAPYQHALNSKL